MIVLLKNDSQNLATHFDFKFVLQALKDYKSYVLVGMYMGYVNQTNLYCPASLTMALTASSLVPSYAISLFTPTIINELGFSATNAQLLSVPPFVVGCICTVLVGIYSDICTLRGPFVIASGTIALVGYIILYTQTNPGVSYTGAILAAAGTFPSHPVILALVSGNAGGDTKRSVVLAMVIGIGNLGG